MASLQQLISIVFNFTSKTFRSQRATDEYLEFAFIRLLVFEDRKEALRVRKADGDRELQEFIDSLSEPVLLIDDCLAHRRCVVCEKLRGNTPPASKL